MNPEKQTGYEKREWISITELVQAHRCLRKAFYKTGCGLTTTDEKIALVFGTAIHAGIPTGWFKGVGEGFIAFDQVWTPSGMEAIGDEKRNRANARLIISDFVQRRTGPHRLYDLLIPPKNFDTHEHLSPYEMPFAMFVEGLRIPIIGRLDGLCKMLSNGQVWTVEYKTTSELAQRFQSAFDMNAQTIGYTIAAREVLQYHPEFQGVPIMGCVVEGIRVNKSSWETQAIPQIISDSQVRMWKDWARFWGNAVLRAEELGEWPQWPDSCNQIGMHGLPGYNCEFLPLCKIPDWTMMRDLYKVERHVPFTVKGKVVG